MRFRNRSALWMIAVLSVLFTASFVLAAVSPADIARIKAKVEAGEMLSQADVRVAEEINATTTSHIEIEKALSRAKSMQAGWREAPRRPRNTLDDYVATPVPYSWVDIDAVGTALTGADDGSEGPFNLGFTFSFYDTPFTSVHVCTNGWLSFTSTGTAYNNYGIPTTDDPENGIFPFWDDLDTGPDYGAGSVKYYADAANQRFIVSWLGVPHHYYPGNISRPYTFQAVVNANGNIVFNYQTIQTDTIPSDTGCTVGIVNADLTQGVQVCFNGTGTLPTSGTSVMIGQPDGVPNPVTNLANVVNGTNVTLTWTDPNHDTNGNVLTPDSIQIFLGNPSLGNMIGHVFHGVQTFVHTSVPSGTLSYYVRAKAGEYVSAAVVTSAVVGNPSYNEDFEISDGMWTSAEGWSWGVATNPGAPAPHSGTHMFGVGMTADYPINVCYNADLNLGLNVTSTTASVEFWAWWETEGDFGPWDGTNFQVSVDEGSTWTVVTPDEGYSDQTGSNPCIGENPNWNGWTDPQWRHFNLPIGQFNGQTPIFRLSFGSDGSNNYSGFFVDDMLIWGLGTPTTYPVSGTVTLDGGLGDMTQVIVRSNGVGNPTTHPAANGTYTLPTVQSGNRILSTSLAGYVTATQPVTVNGPVTNANITMRREAPPAPVLVSVEVNSSTGLATLVWTNTDPSVDLYKIYRKDRDATTWTLGNTITGVNNLTGTDQLPTAGVWQYVVTSTDQDLVPPPIESEYSNMIQVIYGALPPVALGADGRFDDHIHLSWLTPGTNPEFEIFYDTETETAGGLGFQNIPSFGWMVSHFQGSGPITINRLRAYFTATSSPGQNYEVGVFEDDGTGLPTFEPLGVAQYTMETLDEFIDLPLESPVTVESGSFFIGVRQIQNFIGIGGDDNATYINNTFLYSFDAVAWHTFESVELFYVPMLRAFVTGNMGSDLLTELSPSPVNKIAAKNAFPISTPKGMKTAAVTKTSTSKAAELLAAKSALASVRPSHHNGASLAADHAAEALNILAVPASDHGRRNTLDNVVYYKVYRGTTPDALSDIAHVNGENTLFYDDPVAEGITYHYAVSAYYDNNQESTQTTPPVAAMAHMAPGAPTSLTAVSVGVTQKRFNWVDPTVNANGSPCVDLANLRVYRDGTLISTVAPGVQTYTDTPPQNDQIYHYEIKGIDEVPNEGSAAAGDYGVIPPWEPVAYSWIDISEIGTDGPFSDDANLTADLGFEFMNDYYPTPYTQIHICTNGWASFTSTSTAYGNVAIPDVTEPNTALYPFWDDFVPLAGQIKYYSDVANNRFVISYLDVPHITTEVPESFQMVIYAGGWVDFNYQQVNTNTGNTIGVENVSGTAAYQLYFDGAGPFVPVSGSSVSFWRGPEIFAPVSGTVTLDGGAGTAPQVLLTSSGMRNRTVHPLANGTYAFDSVQVGNRRITATLAGYHTVVLPITIPETGYTNANLTLRRLDPVAPTNLAATVNSTNGHCDLTWTISPDLLVDGYKLYRRLQGETTWNLVQTVTPRTTVAYTDILTTAGIYQYVLTAFDNGVVPPALESAYSNQIQVLYGSIPPVFLAANGNFDNKIHLSWFAPGTEPEFEVFYDTGVETAGGLGFQNIPSFGWMVAHFQGAGPIAINTIRAYFTTSSTIGQSYEVGVFEDDGTGIPTFEPLGVAQYTMETLDEFIDLPLAEPVTVASGSFFIGLRQIQNFLGVGGDGEAEFLNNTFQYSFEAAAWHTYESVELFYVPMIRAYVTGNMGGDLTELTPSPVTTPTAKSVFPISTPKGMKAAKSATVSKVSPSNSKEAAIRAEKSKLTSVHRSNRSELWRQQPHLTAADAPMAMHILGSGRTTGRGHRTLDEVVNYRIMSPDANTILGTVPGTQLFYDHTPLEENIPHNYWVRAVYDNGQVSLPSQTEAVVARCNAAPSAPTNLNCTTNGSTTLTLTWTNPTTNTDGSACVDMVESIVYRDGEIIATVPAPGASFVDTPPVPDQFYTYTIMAADEIPNESALSAPTSCAVVSPWQVVDYEWVDITADGTPCCNADDITEGPFDLGFDFEFYGNTYNSVNVCSNGWLSFTSVQPVRAWTNTCLPTATADDPVNAIFVNWDDMTVPSGGQILYYADAANQRFIVSWEGVPHYQTTDPNYFQVIIAADNSVTFNYQLVVAVDSSTIGVQNEDGSSFIQLICSGSDANFTPNPETAVQFWGGPSGQINGQVRSFGGNPQPIPNATVYAIQGTDSIAAITDASGNYVLRVEPATFSVYMKHNNYCDTLYTNVVVEDGGTTTRNGTLKAPGFENDHTSLNIQAHQNETVATSYHITNPVSAQCPLDFRVTHTGLPWLTIGPASGSIDPGSTWEIWVTALPTVVPGDYNTNIVTSYNAAGTPNTMPIDINVLDAPQPGTDLPKVFALGQNYPNPFNPTTVLPFEVPQQSRVEIMIYNVMGQEVLHPVSGDYVAGRYKVTIDAGNLPSGMYLVKMHAGDFSSMNKMMLLK